MHKEESDDLIIEKAKKSLEEKIRKILPNFWISQSSASYADVPNNFSVNNPRQVILKDTSLYYDGEFKLIHFTSLKNAVEILNSGFLYLSNLSMLDDPNEFSSGAFDLAGILKENIEGYKHQFFQISFCEYVDSEEMHFDNWRFYGENGKGVGLVFKIEPEHFESWYNYFLSNIIYEGQEKHKQIKSLYETFISEIKNFEQENNFQVNNKELILMRVYSFIKKGIYQSESEVRVLYFDEYNNSNNYSLSNEYELRPKTKLYLNFGFHENINEEIRDTIKSTAYPKINLESIIVGYRYNETDFRKISIALNSLYYRMTKNAIDIKQSQLRKFFS